MAKQAKRQLAGSGDAMPAGSAGELIESIGTSNVALSTTAGTYTDTGLSVTLSPGVWEIETQVTLGCIVTVGTGNNGRCFVATITDNSNNIVRAALSGFCNQSTSSNNIEITVKARVNIASSTTYKVRGTTVENTGTATTCTSVTTIGSSTWLNVLRAVRIA